MKKLFSTLMLSCIIICAVIVEHKPVTKSGEAFVGITYAMSKKNCSPEACALVGVMGVWEGAVQGFAWGLAFGGPAGAAAGIVVGL